MIGFGRIALGILAGGRASRLEGADKAMLKYRGETLLQRTQGAFPEDFGERLCSYNRAADTPSLCGMRVVADIRSDFPGPLAALETLSAICAMPWLMTIPVDCREIPASLADDLVRGTGRDGAVLRDGDGLQPLVALWRVDALRAAVADAFASQELAVHKLLSRLEMGLLDISPRRLGNLNTPVDFAAP